MINNDLISREAVLKLAYWEGSGYIRYGVVDTDDIENLPAVDAVPVIHAKWIVEEKEFSVMGKDGFIRQQKKKTYTCPICLVGIVGLDNMNFCPNCGVKMDDESNE